MNGLRWIRVIPVTLAATLLTGSVWAQTTPSAPEPPVETALALRPSKPPLTLDSAPSSSGAGWKLAALALLGAGAFWAWKQRFRRAPADPHAQLRVLRRTTIGVRSELLVLEVEGQKLLIGVTPSSMQTLFLLPDHPVEEPTVETVVPERRIATLLESRIAPREETRAAARAPEVTPPRNDEPDLEGQAAGLRAIGARR
jgi:flagellar protein FliO/FliZ